MKKLLSMCIITFSLLFCTACLGDNLKDFVRADIPDKKIVGQIAVPNGWYVTEKDSWIYICDENDNYMLVEYLRGGYKIIDVGGDIQEKDTREYNPYFSEKPILGNYIIEPSGTSSAFTLSVTTDEETISTYGIFIKSGIDSSYTTYFAGVSDLVTEETIKKIAHSYKDKDMKY